MVEGEAILANKFDPSKLDPERLKKSVRRALDWQRAAAEELAKRIGPPTSAVLDHTIDI